MLFIKISNDGLWTQIEQPTVHDENNYIQYDEYEHTVRYKERVIEQLENQNKDLYHRNLLQEQLILSLQQQITQGNK